MSHALWAFVALILIWRADLFGQRWLEQHDPVESEDTAVMVPDDLAALALGETAAWAQDSVMAAIRESWERHHDWNRVRAAMGVAQRDDE